MKPLLCIFCFILLLPFSRGEEPPVSPRNESGKVTVEAKMENNEDGIYIRFTTRNGLRKDLALVLSEVPGFDDFSVKLAGLATLPAPENLKFTPRMKEFNGTPVLLKHGESLTHRLKLSSLFANFDKMMNDRHASLSVFWVVDGVSWRKQGIAPMTGSLLIKSGEVWK